MSVRSKYGQLEQAYPDMLQGIVALIQKGKLSTRFQAVQLTQEELQQLETAKELCEVSILQQWNSRDTQEFKALCATYFDIVSLLLHDAASDLYIYEQIKLISLGYLGEHWHFVRQYLKAQAEEISGLDAGDDWNARMLTLCFKALVYLVRKNSWADIDKAVSLINQLRAEQQNFETDFLGQVGEYSRGYGASELVSLYHFAKSIELLGQYLMEGRPNDIETQLHYHVGLSREFAQKAANITLKLLYQFFEAFAIKMVRNTIWYTTRGVNNWITKFNHFIANREDKGVFELLYPQKESILAGQLLNPAHRAIVLNLPTSSGKTMIAEYRILQALNQFKELGGWVAYVVPTKALANQLYNQLNKELGTIGIRVEKASGAIELDGFEQYLVEDSGNRTNFDVLITTYEKMNLLVRQGLGTTSERPLVLTVVDEAHNIEEATRGLTLELLLSTIRNDCEEANFLLMTPDISNSAEVVDWLAGDRGSVINLELDWWQPNERVVGAIEVNGRGRNYDLSLKTLLTDKATYQIGDAIPLASFQNAAETKAKLATAKSKIAACVAAEFLCIDRPLIVLARNPAETYTIAEQLYQRVGHDLAADDDVRLLKLLVQSELGDDFPLAKFLDRRIAVHSSALPDEIRFLVEDLMATGKLQALVATTTIAQGINFPVSAVIMGSYSYPFGTMPVRDFWNLAGRVGRAGQDNMGWVGIAVKNGKDLLQVTQYVNKASEDLHSQLVSAIDTALRRADKDLENWLFVDERWSAILQYISHLRKLTEDQGIFLAQLEQKLQGTLGYRQLPQHKKDFLRQRIRAYANSVSVADAHISDSTGFSTVTVRQMIRGLAKAQLTPQDWQGSQLFSEQNQSMRKLVGIMLDTYEIRRSIQNIHGEGKPLEHTSVARLMIDWVNGKNIASIASRVYPHLPLHEAIEKATKSLYSVVANSATWGLAAMQQMPTSGVDWNSLSDIEKKRMANLPAYLHYGVNTDEGVLMRKNNVPRSIANRLGQLYSASVGGVIFNQSSSAVSAWIGEQGVDAWNTARPAGSKLSAAEYKRVWEKLNGA
ncbi:DEAD/DEAH box helicase [Parapedobacter sp. 2B3]|uniref:DEAD/DEAH box helicase n=1 Tax=Parapedobacter sp. 2B3 TaxID=3342381 RepID=UPI0035B68C6C